MKRIQLIAAAAITVFGTACNKEKTQTTYQAIPRPIILGAEGIGFDAWVSTKVSEITSLNSFFLTVTKGSEQSQTAVWNNSFFNLVANSSPASYTGNKFWPASDLSYHFFASNVPMNNAGSTGPTVSVDNTIDAVCAMELAPEFRQKCTLSFEHIFARIGHVAVSPATGYTISDVQMSITPRTGGTYSIYGGDGHSDASGWSQIVNGSPTVISDSNCPSTKFNSLYLVPGRYTLTASWTAKIDEYTISYSGKTVEVDLTKGMINNITATLGGAAGEISLGVSVNPWLSNTIDAAFTTD